MGPPAPLHQYAVVARPVAVAWLVQGVLHLVFHAGHLDGYDTVDKVGLIVSLITVPSLALVALWAGTAEHSAHP